MLRTRSILVPKELDDGVRISIMSRHTLNDGMTPHPEITDSSYDHWLKIFAPPEELVGDYYKRNLPWNLFKTRYLEYLRNPFLASEVRNLALESLYLDITLLCIETHPDYCHRRLLAEECERYEPASLLDIR